jgi:hypothetical protein
MFWWVFWVLLKSLDSIYWKKSLDQSREIPPFLMSFLWSLLWIVLASILIFFKIKGTYDFKVSFIFYVFLCLWLRLTSSYLMQKVYRVEKLSTIAPYENTNEMLSIILAFFVFHDVSVITFFIALTIVLLTALFTIDFKKLKLPKSFKTLFLAQALLPIYYIGLWILIKQVTYTEYFTLEAIWENIILFTLVIYQWKFRCLKNQTSTFYKSRFAASVLGYSGAMLSMYIVSQFWLLISMLFSFMYVAFTMILSFIFFRDKPTVKNIIYASIVITLVITGYYFS